ncbi:MAG: hypothetical protein UW07_C0039G0014 [Candidatus Nomurabacteria bacterium GW2011_GWF2_43_8]|uniref:Uncharacterized protein n=1 Tax=Candidatus Nomurabacteria bacterium GW2011_GWF2_43_8 TaxID=1618779 RepID=A0A0G1FIW5_9BACT|nr:MAG: hypothetical protein UW07_C0039G0014 [Candidatus Nomurabacteria bacterium GW2011_GWF2_43_8]
MTTVFASSFFKRTFCDSTILLYICQTKIIITEMIKKIRNRIKEVDLKISRYAIIKTLAGY